jgi:hypothetical protein
MDDRALRNARKNLIGGAILLPLALGILAVGVANQGRVSLLWVAITVACLLYMVRSYQLLQAAKAAVVGPTVAQPSQFGPFVGTATVPKAQVEQALATPGAGVFGSAPARQNPSTTAGLPGQPPETATPVPAPGWYPDPRGQTRWWDGMSWTQYVQPTI